MEQTSTLTRIHWQQLANQAAPLASADGPSKVASGMGFAEAFPDYASVLEDLAATPIDPNWIEITTGDRAVIPLSDYSSTVDEGRVQLDLDAVDNFIAAGATVLLPRLNRSIASVAIPDDLMVPAPYTSIDVFAFISSPATQSYGVHHDLIDALIVQISGSKDWRAWDVSKGTKPGDGTVEYREEALGTPDLATRLGAGEIIRLPRNAPHVVRSNGEVTFHLAVGFRRPFGQ